MAHSSLLVRYPIGSGDRADELIVSESSPTRVIPILVRTKPSCPDRDHTSKRLRQPVEKWEIRRVEIPRNVLVRCLIDNQHAARGENPPYLAHVVASWLRYML